MGRLLLFGGLALGAYVILSQPGPGRFSTGGGAGFSSYTGSSAPAIKGIAASAGQ